MQKQPSSTLRRTATEIKQYRTMLRITPIVIGILALLLILVYVMSALYGKYGSFTVAVDKYDATKQGLSLCYTPEFDKKNTTSHLVDKVSTDITNIDGDTLPADLDNINGAHNGENYAAYTFYCKNTGVETVTYRYQLYIANMTNDIEKAIRIRLYVNGEPTTYARTASDGSGPEPGTTEFLTNTIVAQRDIGNFAPGDITKYTVVIWLEGNDPDCVDNILGGVLKVSMSMSILEIEA